MTWVAAGIGSGMATMAGIQYIKGKRDQKKDEKNRPVYHTPDQIGENHNIAEQQAMEGLPETQKEQYLSNLERGSAYGLRDISSRNNGVAGVGRLDENMNQGYFNLMGADAAKKQENIGVLMQQNQIEANYADQEFQFNKVNPYYEGIARKQARTAALFQNLNNAAMVGMGGMGGGQKSTGSANSAQYGQIGQANNYYNYNPYSNKNGIVPDGSPYGDMNNIG